jgi:hypothetical protein
VTHGSVLFILHSQGIELAKVPRTSKEKTRSRAKGKAEKNKGEEKKDQQVLYDYLDSSVHDLPLRMDLLQGYEQFKACAVALC